MSFLQFSGTALLHSIQKATWLLVLQFQGDYISIVFRESRQLATMPIYLSLFQHTRVNRLLLFCHSNTIA